MRRDHRRRDQRGAAAVEFALVVPLLLGLVFGTIEVVFLVRDYIAVASVTRVGARIASAAPGAGEAVDCKSRDAAENETVCAAGTVPRFVQMAATAMRTNGSAMPMDRVQGIMVYKASTDASAPGPASVAACTAAIECVWFRWDDASSTFKHRGGAWNEKKVNSCPITVDPKTGAVTNADKVGVKMIATHPSMLGVFGNIVIEDYAVMTFEPETLDKCKPTA